jgi:hypothetical protein
MRVAVVSSPIGNTLAAHAAAQGDPQIAAKAASAASRYQKN